MSNGTSTPRKRERPERPDRPVLITSGTLRAAKRWVIEQGFQAHEYRWLSDSTAVRELAGDRWYHDVGPADTAPDSPARRRYNAAKAELVRLEQTGRLSLALWEENA